MVRWIGTLILMILVPGAVGTLFSPLKKTGAGYPFFWIAGQMLLWAIFLLICAPATILGKATFRMVRTLFFAATVILLVLALAVGAVRSFVRRKAGNGSAVLTLPPKEQRDGMPLRAQGDVLPPKAVFLWILFGVLLSLQLFLLCALSYEEGDDAYYVAVTTLSMEDDAMPLYTKLPYTAGSSELDARHALAPMPVWIAVLAYLAGTTGAACAHVLAPLVLVPMTYAMYFLFAEKLFSGEEGKNVKIPLFLCFTALLILFGGYSTYSPENFLLVRSAQGKSILANLVIPFLLYLLYQLMETLEKKEKPGPLFAGLSAAVMLSGCLCSTLGSFLLCMLLGIAMLCALVIYRKWWLVIYTGLCMVPPVIFALLYLKL